MLGKILDINLNHLGRQIENQIIWEGVDITNDISDDIISLTASDSINEFDTVDLEMENRDERWYKSWMPKIGETILFKYKLTNWEFLGIQEYEVGKFYIDDVRYSGPPDKVMVKAISVDTSSTILEEKKNRVWEKVTLEKIAKDIASSNNLELIYESDFNREYSRLEQKLEPDITFLRRITKELGINIKLYNDKLILFDENKYVKKEPIITLTRTDLKSYDFSTDNTDMYSKCTISYFDPRLKKKIEVSYTAKGDNKAKRANRRTLFIDAQQAPPGKTKEQKQSYLLEIAKRELEQKVKHAITGSISIMGRNQPIIVGDTLQILGFGEYEGKYLIEGINTEYTTFTLSLKIRKQIEEETENG